ncbi:MAG: hypothetical protein ACRD38_00945 [Nitrososphaerales archaeon]
MSVTKTWEAISAIIQVAIIARENIADKAEVVFRAVVSAKATYQKVRIVKTASNL